MLHWVWETSSEDWKNITAGLASIATTMALLVGGIWALRKFRRTPESRIKIQLTVDVDWPDHDSPFVRVSVVANNDGGYRWTLWWSARHSSRPENWDPSPPGIDPPGGASTLLEDISRVALWALTADEVGSGELTDPYVAWGRLSPSRAEVGCEAIELRPRDTWSNDLLFRLPERTVAIRAGAWIWVKTRRDIYPIEVNRIATRPARVRN